ncbi:6062_t:CDS:1, partial [Dentiscutata heterogama]
MCQIRASINFTQRKKPYKPSNNPAYQSVEPEQAEQNELNDQGELDKENNSEEDAETNISDTMAWESRLQ